MQKQIADTILSQISLNTKMCVSATDYKWLEQSDDYSGGVVFRIRIDNQRRYIRVELKYNDTYRVAQVLVRKGEAKETFAASDVYCDVLDEVVYRLGSTRGASQKWLAEYGIKKY